MIRLRTGLGAIALLTASLAAAPVQASSVLEGYLIRFDVTSSFAVDRIMMFERTASGPGFTYSFAVGPGTTRLTDPFTKYQPITGAFLLGIATDLPGDPPGQEHLVIFSNQAWAANAEGIAFGTLFPTILESTLIDAINTENDPFATGAAVDAADNVLFGFNEDFADNSTNNPASIIFQPGDAFTLIAFSNGTIVGGGQSSTAPVPEPASWALMIAGFGLVGGAMRRKFTLGTMRPARA